MGMGAGFGQSTGGQTGVGSSSTQSNAPTGGKGGGMATPMSAQNPYASSQPQQPQPQPYQPMGGNVFGYNMARLSRQMDPSATLPGQPPAQPQQYEMGQPGPGDAMGGKGGGMGGYGDYSGFGPQAPSFFQPVQGQEFQAQQPNPFDQGFNAQQERMAQLERQLADLTSRQQTQAQQRDTGEVRADLPEPFEEFGVGQSPAETAAEAAAEAPTTGYQFGTYTNFNPQELTGFSKNQISQLYKQHLTTANADIKEAQRMQNAAKTPAEIRAANDALAAANTRRNTITADQKAALSLVGKTGYQAPASATPTPAPAAGSGNRGRGSTQAAANQASTGNTFQQNLLRAVGRGSTQAAANQASTGNTFQQNLLRAVGRGGTSATTNQNATTLANVRTQTNAKGGVIHTGMSSKLKKQLGTK